MQQHFARFFIAGKAQPSSLLCHSARTKRTAFSAALRLDPSGAIVRAFAYLTATILKEPVPSLVGVVESRFPAITAHRFALRDWLQGAQSGYCCHVSCLRRSLRITFGRTHYPCEGTPPSPPWQSASGLPLSCGGACLVRARPIQSSGKPSTVPPLLWWSTDRLPTSLCVSFEIVVRVWSQTPKRASNPESADF